MKKTTTLLAISTAIFFSCNSSSDVEVAQDDTLQDAPAIVVDNTDVWTMEYDPLAKKDTMIKHRELNSDSLTPQTLIDILNASWERVHIDYVKTSHDTVFVKIPDSKVLTQEMGNSGADQYISTVIYTMTELKGIKYVNFDFKEGSHATPGTFTR